MILQEIQTSALLIGGKHGAVARRRVGSRSCCWEASGRRCGRQPREQGASAFFRVVVLPKRSINFLIKAASPGWSTPGSIFDGLVSTSHWYCATNAFVTNSEAGRIYCHILFYISTALVADLHEGALWLDSTVWYAGSFTLSTKSVWHLLIVFEVI